MFEYQKVMHDIVEQSIAAGNIVGANVLMIKDNEEMYFESQGFADKELGVPMKRDTIFRLFSMTKPITAVAVLMLAERGKIDLWDKVSDYIPEFAEMFVTDEDGNLKKAENPITIWHLLTMTSGIPYPDTNFEAGRRMDMLFKEIKMELKLGRPTDTLTYCGKIANIPLCFEPGTTWQYGLSADILGGIVEIVAGEKFGTFLQRELFEPLGMKDTGFVVPKYKRHRFATNYEWSEQNGMLIPFTKNHLGLEGYGEDVVYESGGAGLVSTIDDYSHFAMMLLNGGTYEGKKIMGRRSIELMRTNHLGPNQRVSYNWDNNKGHGYGCLVRVLENPGLLGSNAPAGEFGWDGWTGNYITICPSENMTLLYFIQRCGAGTTAEARKLRMAAYAALD